jgi:drug/metabolite transporter (DMT)-like permease
MIVLLGLLGNALFHSLLVAGIHRTSSGHAALLVALSPVLAALLARVLLAEPLGAHRLAGIALGFAGVTLIVTRESLGAASTRGDLLSLGASLSWALYTVVGKPVLARATPLAVTTWATLFGVIPMLPFGVPGLREVRWGALTAGQWLLLLYLSAGTIAVANLLWYMALARTTTARVVVFSFMIPVIAMTIAILAGQESLTPSLALGTAAVLSGVALTRRP